mmetsp:Transcript_16097/g.40689  ORF Transcript_16097/g.40689 Transcript_16097/m.40689 type:complete len:236 (-) Transcript_16097:332-1039(-)
MYVHVHTYSLHVHAFTIDHLLPTHSPTYSPTHPHICAHACKDTHVHFLLTFIVLYIRVQTYENPEEVDPNVDIRALGDGDPLDAVELSDEPIEMGTLGEVIPVGVLCLIDEGEVDWKLFVLRADHPLVEKKRREKEVSRGGHRTSSTSPSTFNAPYLTLDDVEEHFPGKMSAIREWFRTYKTFEGKDENKFGLNEEIKDGEFAWKVIFQCHHEWRDLVGGNNPRNLPIPDDLLLL